MRAFLALASFGCLACVSAPAEVLWRASSTWPDAAEGSLLTLSQGQWAVMSETPLDLATVRAGRTLVAPPADTPDESAVVYYADLPSHLNEAYLGVTLVVNQAATTDRPLLGFAAEIWQRSTLTVAQPRHDGPLRLGLRPQGGRRFYAESPTFSLGQPLRVVIHFKSSEVSRLWLGPPGSLRPDQPPDVVTSQTTNPNRVNKVSFRLDPETSYLLSDWIVATDYLSAARP